MEASRLQSESSDYISDLPDNVLHHILSFLPIKDCIRTSFLSRRWRYLWTLVPNLDFDGLIFSPKVKFMNFVDSVLRRRNGCGIQSFRLRFGYYYCESSRVQSWIVSAISHNVRELSISSYTMEPFDDLPSCIFTCSSLTTLTLNLFHSTIRLPSSCHLPFLKTIELSSVIFSDDNLNLFFSHCPNLETFSLQGCFVRNLRILHISAPYLQRLCIHGMRQSGSDGSFLNEIMISTPRLLSLECSDINMCLENNISLANVDISFENMSSLVSASIDFSFRQDNFTRMNSLLRGLSIAKVLALSSGTVRLLALVPNLLGQLHTFSNLIHLKLSANSDDTLRILTSFLHNAPNLEFLSVDLLPCWYWFSNEVCFEPQKVECVIDHLKVVEIKDFRGDEKEIAIVKYMLQHAHILERMVIVFSKQLSAKSDRQMEIREDILMHPRSSVNSEVICEFIVQNLH